MFFTYFSLSLDWSSFDKRVLNLLHTNLDVRNAPPDLFPVSYFKGMLWNFWLKNVMYWLKYLFYHRKKIRKKSHSRIIFTALLHGAFSSFFIKYIVFLKENLKKKNYLWSCSALPITGHFYILQVFFFFRNH